MNRRGQTKNTILKILLVDGDLEKCTGTGRLVILSSRRKHTFAEESAECTLQLLQANKIEQNNYEYESGDTFSCTYMRIYN